MSTADGSSKRAMRTWVRHCGRTCRGNGGISRHQSSCQLAPGSASKEKRCHCCELILPLSAFANNKRRADGLDGRCRECHYLADIGRKISESTRLKQRESRLARGYDQKKLNAKEALGRAVRTGQVQRWPVCEIPTCEEQRVHGHHADYDNPLGVTWLCARHHALAHALLRKIQ